VENENNKRFFLLVLSPSYGIQEHARVSVYDPVFTDEDVVLLTKLKLYLLTENKASGPSRLALRHH
jgi:SRR1